MRLSASRVLASLRFVEEQQTAQVARACHEKSRLTMVTITIPRLKAEPASRQPRSLTSMETLLAVRSR
jgi:hypothetical protein